MATTATTAINSIMVKPWYRAFMHSALQATHHDRLDHPALQRDASWHCGPGAFPSLLDHFVGLKKDGPRNGHAERLCCLLVHHEFESRHLLEGKIARLCALQDLVHIVCGAPMH